ncbi:MAG: hypothetical protein DRI57_17325, partial [Deltaproteobacteria bacterium]
HALESVLKTSFILSDSKQVMTECPIIFVRHFYPRFSLFLRLCLKISLSGQWKVQSKKLKINP